MWRLLVLGLVVVALDAPAAWYLEDREGTVAADEAACAFFDPQWAHLAIRENATSAGWDLVVVNPAEFEYTFWGAETRVDSWRVRWDGRLAPLPEAVTTSDFTMGHEGTRVPPGGEAFVQPVAPASDAPGEYVLRAQMEGLCATARVRVP